MGAKIYTNPNMVIDTSSDFGPDEIMGYFQQFQDMKHSRAASARADRQLDMQQAAVDYQKGLYEKAQRSINRMSSVSEAFNTESLLTNPTASFGESLPDMQSAWDKYKKGQNSDDMGADFTVFQDQYKISAIKNLNQKIGMFESLRARVKAARPMWDEDDINDYMNKTYNANQLYQNYMQLGGGGMEQVVAPDGKTTLRSFSYSPKAQSPGLLERGASIFIDPYTGKLRGTNLVVGGGAITGAVLHKRQLANLTDEAKKLVKSDAAHVRDGGLTNKEWTKKYGKVTKKSILAQADELARKTAKKGTTLSKITGKASKAGKQALPYMLGINLGGAAGEALGSETLGQVTGGIGTWQIMKKLKDPKVMKSVMGILKKKYPAIATKLGLSAAGIALPEGVSTALGLAGATWTAYDIAKLFSGDEELQSALGD